MEKGIEHTNMWVPAEGDVVKIKRGFDQSTEGYALRRAARSIGAPMLEEGKTYEVLEYIQDENTRGLRLHEVKVIHVAGQRHVSHVADVPGTPSIEFFELDRKHKK